MIQVYANGEHVDSFDGPMGEVVAQQRGWWGEDGFEGPLCIVCLGDAVVTMVRDDSDPEICHTMYSDGTVEHHRCHYVLDAQGSYERTEVTQCCQPE